eukprot:2766052-Pyramimonas_sp.AAC.1
MWPLVSPWFRLEKRHAFKDSAGALRPIVATTGVDQDCPSAPYLACLSVAPVHDALKGNSVVVGLQD